MEEKELSVKQRQLIDALIAGNPIVVAARAVGIAEKTAHAWLKQPLFQQEYQSAKHALFDERLGMLRDGISVAMKTLLKHMTNEETPPHVQVRAAQIWLEQSLEIHKMQEIDQRILELEKEVSVLRK